MLTLKRKKCLVCRKKSKWFYENVHFLRTKHSQRTISNVMKIILGNAFDSLCLNPAAMCFKCVNRINEYDEAYGTVQVMERELKSSICVDLNPITEDVGNSVIATDADANADTNESNLENMEMEVDNCVDVLIANDVENGESLEQPESAQADENIEHKPVDVPADNVKNRLEKKKTGVYCKPCKKTFKNQQGLTLHNFYFHIRSERFECPNCYKSYVRQDLLDRHTEHGCDFQKAPKRLKCPLCPRKFVTQSHLKNHRFMHGPLTEMEAPYICDYCGIELSEHTKYLDHRVLHTTRPKFQCLECDRILCTRQVLKVHMTMHTTETPHLCDICGKSYGRAGGLQDHIRRHYNEFRTECYLCKHKEMTISDLRSHMRKHTGEKPFPCSECGKRFSEKNNRDTHYRLHFGPLEKPHKCTICTDAFARPGLLTKHYLKAHGVHKQPATTAKLIKITR